MKRGGVIAAAAVFAGLVLIKTIFPTVGAGARERIRRMLERDPGYVRVFRSFDESLPQSSTDAPEPTPVAASRAGNASVEYVSYLVEDAAVSGEAEAPAPPPAVAAFLESQAAFSDLALPENVEYAYTPFPFNFTLPVSGRNSSGFGYRLHPILQIVRFHYGTDIAAGSGETIAAFADGTVAFAGYDDSFGWHLKIDHGGGWVSHCCHCSRLLVGEGDSVSMGDAVALVGATGLATGPHLHFELTHDGVFVNPEYYINA